jgi:hypothetical protein
MSIFVTPTTFFMRHRNPGELLNDMAMIQLLGRDYRLSGDSTCFLDVLENTLVALQLHSFALEALRPAMPCRHLGDPSDLSRPGK